MKAWANASSFEEGTNMRAWLFTIMRNTFFSQYRKARREVQDVDGEAAARLVAMPDQLAHLDLADFRARLERLPADQREALVLIGASGFSYEEAAEICGCAVGTIKSRVNRARRRLIEQLALSSAEDFGRRSGPAETAPRAPPTRPSSRGDFCSCRAPRLSRAMLRASFFRENAP